MGSNDWKYREEITIQPLEPWEIVLRDQRNAMTTIRPIMARPVRAIDISTAIIDHVFIRYLRG
jgi:hypothetical protein